MTLRPLLYEAPVTQFRKDVLTNEITEVLKRNFQEKIGRTVGEGEAASWNNSLRYVKDLLELADLSDAYIALEYQVPFSSASRIDCVLFGTSAQGKGFVVLIELKQWSKVIPVDQEDTFQETEVETFVGGAIRKVLHPSEQVAAYHAHVVNFVQIFEEDATGLFSCAYCHNYLCEGTDPLRTGKYADIVREYPLYAKNDVVALAEKLKSLLSNGQGFEIFNRFMRSPIRPARKLLEHVAGVIDGEPVYSLLDEQLIAKNAILGSVNRASTEGERKVFIVKGGPGTGKTVIALHLLASMAKENKTVFFASKSKPLIEAIKHKVGRKSGLLFTNLSQYTPSRVDEQQIDLLVVDEAHRVGKSSNSQFTTKEHRTDMPQIDQLIRCAKTAVFFIDDRQAIRHLDVGRVEMIKESAARHHCVIEEHELPSQFRCAGSNDYIAWLEGVLGILDEKTILNKDEPFEFKIFDSPEVLYSELSKRELEKSGSARIVAGFCWPWSKELDASGALVKDVTIGNFAMPWETHEAVRIPPGFVKWYEWAYKPEGFKQVGCIYTAQGFEFDYIGVIVGPDLGYDAKTDKLITKITETKDPILKRSKAEFDAYVRNIYRVLMTRGLKGCYVYFVDKGVEEYFRKHLSDSSK